LGIGVGVDENELRTIATPPNATNYIWVQGFEQLPDVEQRLKNDACEGTNTCCTQPYVRISPTSA